MKSPKVSILRDYASGLAIAVKKVLGPSIPGSNPRRDLLFRPNHLEGARIAQFPTTNIFSTLLTYHPPFELILPE
jgi:hypothetical protein